MDSRIPEFARTRRRWPMVLAAIAAAALAASCGGDDDTDATPTTPAGTPTAIATAPPSSPTPGTPLITIDVPAADASVSVPFEASGASNTFEAALTVDAIDGTGTVLCRRNIMATSGSGTPGTWKTTLAFPPPGADLAATFRAFEFSAKDGNVVNLVERPITVSNEHPPVYITSPACNDAVAPGATLTVTGRGLLFEAVVNLQLRNASGVAVIETTAMAGGTEVLDFMTAIAIPATLGPGLYYFVAFDYSAKDGAIENEFAIPIDIHP